MRKVTVIEAPNFNSNQRKTSVTNNEHHHHHHHNHSKCFTGCAQTYQASRDKRRRAVSTIVNPMISIKQTCSTSEDTSATESCDEVTKLTPIRKKSRFTMKKEETKLVEGKWKLIGNRNYEEYLTELGRNYFTHWPLSQLSQLFYYLTSNAEVGDCIVLLSGTGACTGDMVMRADVVITILQEQDKQWRIAQETLIKAKSVRGYR